MWSALALLLIMLLVDHLSYLHYKAVDHQIVNFRANCRSPNEYSCVITKILRFFVLPGTLMIYWILYTYKVRRRTLNGLFHIYEEIPVNQREREFIFRIFGLVTEKLTISPFKL